MNGTRRLIICQPIVSNYTASTLANVNSMQPALVMYIFTNRFYSDSSNCVWCPCYRTISYSSKHYRRPAYLFLSNQMYRKLLLQPITSESDPSRRQSIAPLLERFQKLENSFRYHGYSTLRIGILITMIIGLTVYIFQDPIRSNVIEEVTQVASRSLEDEQVAIKAEEFSKGLLNAVVSDELTVKLAVNFLQGILDRKETQNTANELVYKVITNTETQQKLACLCKDVLVATLNDPKIKNELIVVMKQVLRSEAVVESLRNLLKHTIMEQNVQEMMAQFFKSVLADDLVVREATVLGKSVTKNIMNDTVIQEQAGSSIWKAVGYSLTPSWFSSSSKMSSSTEPTPVE